MNIQWEDARLFLAVAEAGSVSAAARKLKLTQPTASRRIAQLEATLGEPVFTRSVSGAALTPFGERLLDPARRMAESASDFTRAAERAEKRVEGVVRITAPPGTAYDFCAPFAAFVRERLPDIRLEIVSSVRYLDLSRREADLALRLDRPPGRELVRLRSVEFDVVAFAAREYIARLGRRPRLQDVAWVGWAPPFDQLPPNSVLAQWIPGFRPAFASDDYLVQMRAAELGLGAIILGRMRHRFSRATSLVELPLEGMPRVRSGLHLVCAKGALDVPRIRAVANLLEREIERTDTSQHARAKK